MELAGWWHPCTLRASKFSSFISLVGRLTPNFTLSPFNFKNRLGTGSQTGTNWLHRHHSERTLYLNSPCLSVARLYVYSCITSPLPWFILRDQLGSVYLQLSAGYPSTQRARVAQDPFFAPRWHSHIRIKNRLLQTLVLSKFVKPVNS